MPNERGRLSGEEFRASLAALDETPSSFAKLLVALGDPAEDKVRTVQRWTAEERDVPGPINAVLALLKILRDEAGIDSDRLRAIVGAEGWTPPWAPPSEGGAVVVEDRRPRR